MDTNNSINLEVSNMIVRVFKDHEARGPTKVRTNIARNNVTCILEDTLTKAEQNLVHRGEAQVVHQMRESMQRTMKAEFVAGVESLLQREVVSFMSANDVENGFASEIFVLAPNAD
jgi:uncharacterized protein YbcI